MRTVTATRAARHLSGLLDAVARGETFTITRSGRVVAELRPAGAAPTAGALRRALAGLPPLDDQLEADIGSATRLLTSQVSQQPDR
ncbi:type II toxin-antitoxin system Phd/YefM family antitoxin [Cellulomonas sp. Y8]|uniref:type II toxin-antitoxin system Phd/YefM family antitoxin n=1 Tax=Cellulomonas sp. Y8 TaxID=2591145 RepID=UPI0011CB7C64|nr:type II toxin-antitoxin system prevent-host-death family antitoxin [Cellulomonas sp. Y8]